MAKKTSIMVEVDDRVYDLVIAPHKKNKTFSKLLATLLSGYLENTYIRSFVEDTLDDMRKASSDALEEIIGNMHEGLANMGMYAEELKSATQQGVDTFSERTGSSASVGEEREQNTEEIKELRESIDILKKQNNDIMEMMRQIYSGYSPMNAMGGVAVGMPVMGGYVQPVVVPQTPVMQPTERQQTESNLHENKGTIMQVMPKEEHKNMHEGSSEPISIPTSVDISDIEEPTEEVEVVENNEDSVDGEDLFAALCSGMCYGE